MEMEKVVLSKEEKYIKRLQRQKEYYKEKREERLEHQREYDNRPEIKEQKREKMCVYRAKKRAELIEKRRKEIEDSILQKYNLFALPNGMVGIGAGCLVQSS